MIEHTTPASSRATQRSQDFCCLEHAALEVLPAPVVVHDDRFVYANSLARQLIGLEQLEGLPVDDFVSPEAAEASSARRSLVLSSDARLGDVPVKIRLADGTTVTITARSARACFGDPPRTVLVQVVRELSGAVLVPDAPGPESAAPCGNGRAYGCVHQAAYDVLPVPSAIVGLATVRRMNRAFGMTLGIESGADELPVEVVVHPDFAEAGRDRRHLVIELGAPVSGASVKLRTAAGEPVYAVIDAERVEYGGVGHMAVLIHRVTRV